MNKLLLTNISRLITMEPSLGLGPLGVIESAALVCEGGKVAWVGALLDIPKNYTSYPKHDAKGMIAFPGLVDCHTHLVHAGTRQQEFKLRSEGKSYLEIAAAGGGILSTVQATRKASEDELFAETETRLLEAMQYGTSICEIKTGYGLDLESELKLARVIKRLQKKYPSRIFGTFLAHIVPPEYREKRSEYIDLLANEMLPQIKKLGSCDACDVFVEEGAFVADEARKISVAAKNLGFKLRLHVDQFHDTHGGKLAAELGAVNADHLDYLSGDGILAMQKTGVIPVLLPSVSFFMKTKQLPPVEYLRAAKIPLAIATDYNPGTNPNLNLWQAATTAVTMFGMTADEALMGITVHAAKVLGLDDVSGKIAPGYRSDVLLLDAPDEYFSLYRYGKNCVREVFLSGVILNACEGSRV